MSLNLSRRFLLVPLCTCMCVLCADAAAPYGPGGGRAVAMRTSGVAGAFPDATTWTKAPTAAPFRVTGQAEGTKPNAFQALYDDTALYVRIRVDDPHVNRLKSVEEGQPGWRGVWSNDCVELFLGSATDPAASVHLAVDLLGQRYQNPALSWRSEVKRDKKGYTVVMAVPFTSLSWATPGRGDVCNIKVGHESKTGRGNSMWPLNLSTDFHADKAWGLLYFDTDNLIADGGFVEMAAKKTQRPAWVFTPGYGTAKDTGTMEIVKSPLPDGGRAIRMNKTKAQPSWYPYLSSAHRVALEKGRSYVLSAWVQTSEPWVFRGYFHKKGMSKYIQAFRIKQKPSPDKMGYFEVPFVMPEEADTFHPNIRFAGPATGSMVIDNVALRLDPSADAHVGAKREEAHPIHDLIELAGRGRVLPAHLRKKGLKQYPCEKVVFKDTSTGATIWKMTRWPGYSRHQYANMLCWNANASLLKIMSSRARNLVLTSDGRTMYKLDVPDADWIGKWCPVDPQRLYVSEYRGEEKVFYIYDIATKKKRYLPHTYPRQGTCLWVPHPDGKHLIVVDNSQSTTALTSHGYFVDVDTGKQVTFDFGGVTHQVWFTKRKDCLVYFGYESTNKHYTEARGGAWLINPDGTDLRRVYNPKWVHRDFSPDGKRVVFHNVGLVIVNVIDGKDEEQVSSNSGGHATWQVTPEWFVSSTQGVLRCVGAQGQGFEYVLCASQFQSPFENFGGRERPCSSPDGTKVAYSSTMLGDFDFYNVVSRLPHPPQQVACTVEGRKVHLKWSPPKYHKETKGYFVYRSPESGGDYRQVNTEPVTETAFADELPDGMSHAFYVVSAIEHCGLEGRFSKEVCASADRSWQGPVRRYLEIEESTPTQPLMEFFDPDASCMYVMRMDRADGGKATMPIDMPSAGKYAVWLRARSMQDAGQVTLLHKGARLTHRCIAAGRYTWFKLGLLDLPKGRSRLHFDVKGKRLRLDALFVTNDLEAQPRDRLLWDDTAPAKPQGLQADRAGKSHIKLTWDPVEDKDIAHYNLYASRTPNFNVSQERLIASPLDPKYTDWGLRQSATYYYAVCAVDRRGNMSAPSEKIAVPTDKANGPVLIRQPVGEPRADLPPESSKTRKSLEAMGAFAEKAYRLTKAVPLEVHFNVPSDGEYVVWAKYGLAKKKGRTAIRVVMGKERALLGSALYLIGSGHSRDFSDKASVFVWEAGQTGIGRYNHTKTFPLKKGRVGITLQSDGDSELEVAEVILTTDLGFQPKGIHCYRPGNPEWLEN